MPHTISDSSIQSNTKYFKECPKFLPENHDENVCQPYAYVHGQNPQVDHQNIHQVARDIPLSPQIRTARHTSSVLKYLKTQSDKITSRGKLNPLQERRGGEET